MTTHDAEFADRLDRFLDGLTEGPERSANGMADLEPELAETIRRLRAHDDAPTADPRFARRLLEDLMQTATGFDRFALQQNPTLPQGSHDRLTSPPMPHPVVSRRQRMVAQFATAALLLLTLVGSAFVFGPGRSWRSQLAPAVLPAISATPATPETTGVATKPLLSVTIPTISDDQGFVAIDRYTMPQATTLEANMRGGHIPAVFVLVAGELDVHAVDAPEPVRVIRSGGNDSEETLASGESVGLTTGDAIVVPENGSADLMNLSTEPAVVLFILQPSYVVIPNSNTIPNESLGGGARELEAPLAVSLQQATIAPGATLAGADDPEVEQFSVPVDPEHIMDARTSTNGALRNAGDEPLEAYVLTVTSNAPLP